jgi:hypothetical protein
LPPFTREVRIDPCAEPGLLLTPLQPLGEQDLAHPAALHANALLAQVDHQAIQRPCGERQIQFGRAAQRGGDDGAPFRGGVGRRSPGAHVLGQPKQAALVEPLEPEADRGAAQAHSRRDLRRAQAVCRVLHNLRTADQPCAQRARARHARQLIRLVIAQGAHPEGHRHAPAQTYCQP